MENTKTLEARTLADFDRIKAEADAADPMKPGMWRIADGSGTRMGRYTEDVFDVIDRAAKKFGSKP